MIMFNYEEEDGEEYEKNKKQHLKEKYNDIVDRTINHNPHQHRNMKHNTFSENNLALSAEVLKQGGPHTLPEKDQSEYPFYKLFGDKTLGKLRSGYKVPNKKNNKKIKKKKKNSPNNEQNRSDEEEHLSKRRLGNVLTQLVSDSHKSKLQQLKRKRDIKRQQSIKKGIVEADNADTSESWQHFREKPIEKISQRTAIDCGINLIQVEMEKERAQLEREARLGVTGEGGKVKHKSTLQLLYLHNDENDR